MSPKSKMGRPSIFRGKQGGRYVQAIITKTGGIEFQRARLRLGKLVRLVRGVMPATISDADVVEYLARGDENTRAYLEAQYAKTQTGHTGAAQA